MNAVERVKSICKERKIPISKLESDCGFSNGYIGQLRKGTFPDDRLHIIADYLNEDAEYLSKGRISPFSDEMAEKDKKLRHLPSKIKDYALILAEMPEEQQEHIMSLIDMLNKSNK